LIKLWHDKIACRVLGALHQQRALIRNAQRSTGFEGVEGPRQHHATIFSRSQLVLPLQLLHCCQSICEFFMISSASDIVLLQVGRVLISDDKSAFWHCARSMSNTNLSRIRLFGASDALAAFPSHHLEHAKSPHCRGKSYHGQYSMLRSANGIVFCVLFSLTQAVSLRWSQMRWVWNYSS
jgi:hypothetical protein